MDTTTYINYFEEMKGRSETEQARLLEEARHVAFSELNLNGKSALFMVISTVFSVLIPVSGFLALGYSLVGNAVMLGVGILFGLKLNHWLQGGLLRRGLLEILKQ